MTHHHPVPAVAGRRRARTVAAKALVAVALVGAAVPLLGHLGHDHPAATVVTTLAPTARGVATHRPAATPTPHPAPDRPGHPGRTGPVARATTGDEGQGSQHVTVFDDLAPSVANLDPALLGALREAATEAADDGVELDVNSGWRSAAHQEQLLQDAIVKYGSAREAARWVATPQTSAHVSGDAVDIGPSGAASWLSHHGAAYGLCQIYRNEPWHYELRPGAADHGCPAMYADPTQDPRMAQ